MAIKITDVCINCGACEPECPNNAIYEGGAAWRLGEGTKAQQLHKEGINIDAHTPQRPLSEEFFYIVSDKCTECVGFHEEPQCAAAGKRTYFFDVKATRSNDYYLTITESKKQYSDEGSRVIQRGRRRLIKLPRAHGLISDAPAVYRSSYSSSGSRFLHAKDSLERVNG
eukprot:gene141-190_t